MGCVLTKPGTWENGFKNSPQAETTQLREMGLFLNPQGKLDPLDNSWNNVLNSSPTLFNPDETFMGKGVYMTSKGIGLGIDPMSPEIGFGGTYGILVEQDVVVYRTDDNARAARLVVGSYNRPLPGGTQTGKRAEWHYDFLGEQARLFAYDYDLPTPNFVKLRIDGNPILINGAVGVDLTGLKQPITAIINGNFVIGDLTLGATTTADQVLGIRNGTAPDANIAGIQMYALSGGTFVRGGSGKTTTLGDTKGNIGLDFPNSTDIAFPTNAYNNLTIADGVAPGANITGVQIYAISGAAKVRGSGGTITTFGAADPHCQRCGKDFAMEWENEKYGKLSICAWCLSEKFEDIVIEKYEGGN
jgi:hypothetical protein